MRTPCTVRLDDVWRSPIDAWLIGFMPGDRDQTIQMAGCQNPTPPYHGGDGIVVLRTFDIGRVLQLPMRLIKVDPEWIREDT